MLEHMSHAKIRPFKAKSYIEVEKSKHVKERI